MSYEDVFEKAKEMFGKSEKLNEEKMETKKAQKVQKDYEEARSAKEDIKTKWIEFVKLWRGDHWSNTRKQKWQSDAVENICFSVVETMVPLMSDRAPQINYLPQTEEDIEAAKQLNMVAHYNWNSDNMNEKMPRVMRDMLILGTGIMKMRWDTDKYNGMGDITADVIDPFHFFPDPDATSPEDMQWCILKTKIPVRKLQRIYGKEVPSDSEYNADDHKRPSNTNDNKGNYSSTAATVLEYWYYDEEGRLRVSVVSNGVLLDDKESPYETNDMPFIFFKNHQSTSEFWSLGEFENLAPLQKALNKAHSIVMDNMIATNNTMIVVDSTAGVKAKELRNEPGLVIEKQPGGKVERLAPPAIPNYFLNQIEVMKGAMQEVSGIHDVTKGMAQGSVTAASAIQTLQEASQTRIRGKLKNAESAVKQIAGWYLVMIRQFYTEDRIIRLTDEKQGFKFVTFNGQELRTEQPQIDPQTGEIVINEDTGEPQMEVLLTDFDIKISSGSSMMLNKSAKYAQIFELYQAGAVDIETLINAADIGDSKEIVAKLIKFGALPDPERPQIDLASALGDLGFRFNMTSNDPNNVLEALQNAQAQLNQHLEQEQMEQQQREQQIPETLNPLGGM